MVNKDDLQHQIEVVSFVHSRVLEEIHYFCFDESWDADEFACLLEHGGTAGFLASFYDEEGEKHPAGFILYRVASVEAEILTLAILPLYRRCGFAENLLQTMIKETPYVEEFFLEVSIDNKAAVALYQKNKFLNVGYRRHYYGPGRDAYVLKYTRHTLAN